MSLSTTTLGVASDVLQLTGEAVEALGIVAASAISSRLMADSDAEPPDLALVAGRPPTAVRRSRTPRRRGYAGPPRLPGVPGAR